MRFITDNPKTNTETMLNYAFAKDGEVNLRDGTPNGKKLCDFIYENSRKLCEYVMTSETYEKIKSKIPYKVGVYTCDCQELKLAKKAKRCDRSRCTTEMLLMMFRSSNRDVLKYKKLGV